MTEVNFDRNMLYIQVGKRQDKCMEVKFTYVISDYNLSSGQKAKFSNCRTQYQKGNMIFQLQQEQQTGIWF